MRDYWDFWDYLYIFGVPVLTLILGIFSYRIGNDFIKRRRYVLGIFFSVISGLSLFYTLIHSFGIYVMLNGGLPQQH